MTPVAPTAPTAVRKPPQRRPALTSAKMRMETVLQSAITSGALSDASPSAIFYNLTELRQTCTDLVHAFPQDALHAFALKACPLVSVVRAVREEGLGGECASIAEVAVCAKAGLPSSRVIYDSPAKTDAHLREALMTGVHINADNIEELRRIQRLRRALPQPSASTVGLRVNPQMGSGTIAQTYTASPASKFGEPLTEKREAIFAAFREFDFLNCIHVHVGSQGCSTAVLVRGAQIAADLADEINAETPGAVTAIDIGGGMSVEFFKDEQGESFYEYADALHHACPNLFKYRIITEFGRKIIAKTAFAAARVQSTKKAGGKTYVICHAGADIFMRAVYQRQTWGHRLEVYGRDGKLKTGNVVKLDVAGPLCFSGDMLAVDVELPLPEPEDLIVVRDTGGYTVSMYSRHTSQLLPPVYGYLEECAAELSLLKKGETTEDVVRFWNV